MTEKERFDEWFKQATGDKPNASPERCLASMSFNSFQLSRIATALERIADGNEQRRKDLHAADEKMAKSAEALLSADERLQKLRGLL